MQKKRSLRDEYRFPGFYPMARIKGKFGEPGARVITLRRTKKKWSAVVAGQFVEHITIQENTKFGIYPAGEHGYIWKWICGGLLAQGAGK